MVDSSNHVDLISELVAQEKTLSNWQEEEKELVENWYFARAYVEESTIYNKLCCVDAGGEAPLQIAVEGASPKMCAIIRELILRAHYIEFREEDHRNQSVITVYCAEGCKKSIENQLRNAPFLSNYIKYSWGTLDTEPLDYLDIKIEVKETTQPTSADITEDMLKLSSYKREIDITKAMKANSIYCVGSDLWNLPDITPEDVKMYDIPLRTFETGTFMRESPSKKWEELSVKLKLSNVFCTDTFSLRLKMLQNKYKDKDIGRTIRDHILDISRCEHSRWVAAQLILNYRPWTAKQCYDYSIIFGDKKNEYYKKLKECGYHPDICSYRDLCRIDPQNRKFDTFLVLSCLTS